MRLLPRTARGTWLLAGAVWLAWCGAVWSVLPVRPRAVWTMPEPSRIIGFLPNTSTLVTAAFVEEQRTRGGTPIGHLSGPLRFWDPSGAAVRGPLLGPSDAFTEVRLSPTGRFAALDWGRRRPHRVVFLPDGLILDPPERVEDLQSFPPVEDSDRWLIVVPDTHSPHTRVWDLKDRRDCGTLRAWGHLYASSDDGRRIVTEVSSPDEVYRLGVWDVEAVRTVFTLPSEHRGMDVTDLSADGAVLAVGRLGVYEGDTGMLTECWSIPRGEQLVAIRNTDRAMFPPDGQILVTHSGASPSAEETRLTVWDLTTRSPRAAFSLPTSEGWRFRPSTLADPSFSPDSRVLALPGALPPWPPLLQWAKRLGVRWPFESSAERLVTRLLDVRAGRWLGEVPAHLNTVGWFPDGTALTTLNGEGTELFIWDIPPRKPLAWLFAAAALLALPLAWLARRRIRRLRPAA
jgi:hypothetical protein